MIYFPYQENIKELNLLYMLYLYGLAEYDNETNSKSKIEFTTRKQLTDKINTKYNIKLSVSTIERLIKKYDSYKLYYNINFSKNQIMLLNSFQKKKQVRFIALSNQEFNILIAQNNDLLCKYYLYLRFNCGKSSSKTIDHSAELILARMGYSTKSNKTKSLLYHFNSQLTSLGLIAISKKTDEKGHTRNVYKII